MGVYTNISFLNANDPEYIKVVNGTKEEIREWESDNGPLEDRPGSWIKCDSSDHVQETNDEYGGWLIPVATLPPGTTHILVSRG